MQTLTFLLVLLVHFSTAFPEEDDSFPLQAEYVTTETVIDGSGESFVVGYSMKQTDFGIYSTATIQSQATNEHVAITESLSITITPTKIEVDIPSSNESLTTRLSFPSSTATEDSQRVSLLDSELPSINHKLLPILKSSILVVTKSSTKAESIPTTESTTIADQISTEYLSPVRNTHIDVPSFSEEPNSDLRFQIKATTTATEFETVAKVPTTAESFEITAVTDVQSKNATPIPSIIASLSMTETKLVPTNDMKPQPTTMITTAADEQAATTDYSSITLFPSTTVVQLPASKESVTTGIHPTSSATKEFLSESASLLDSERSSMNEPPPGIIVATKSPIKVESVSINESPAVVDQSSTEYLSPSSTTHIGIPSFSEPNSDVRFQIKVTTTATEMEIITKVPTATELPEMATATDVGSISATPIPSIIASSSMTETKASTLTTTAAAEHASTTDVSSNIMSPKTIEAELPPTQESVTTRIPSSSYVTRELQSLSVLQSSYSTNEPPTVNTSPTRHSLVVTKSSINAVYPPTTESPTYTNQISSIKASLTSDVKPQATTMITTEFTTTKVVSRQAITSNPPGLSTTESHTTVQSTFTSLVPLGSVESTTTTESTATVKRALTAALQPSMFPTATESSYAHVKTEPSNSIVLQTSNAILPSKSLGPVVLTAMEHGIYTTTFKSASALKSTHNGLTSEAMKVTKSPDSGKSQRYVQSYTLKYNTTHTPQSPTVLTHNPLHPITTKSAITTEAPSATVSPISTVSQSQLISILASLQSSVVTKQTLIMSTELPPSYESYTSAIIEASEALDSTFIHSMNLTTEVHQDIPTISTGVHPTATKFSRVTVMTTIIEPTSTSKHSTGHQYLMASSMLNPYRLRTVEQITTESQSIFPSMTKLVTVSMDMESQNISAIQYMDSPSISETLSHYLPEPSITTLSHVTLYHNISSADHPVFSVLPRMTIDSITTNLLYPVETQSSPETHTTINVTESLMTTTILITANPTTFTKIPFTTTEHSPKTTSEFPTTSLEITTLTTTTDFVVNIDFTSILEFTTTFTADNPTIHGEQSTTTITNTLPVASVTVFEILNKNMIASLFEIPEPTSATIHLPITEMISTEFPDKVLISSTKILQYQTILGTASVTTGDQLTNVKSPSTSATLFSNAANISSTREMSKIETLFTSTAEFLFSTVLHSTTSVHRTRMNPPTTTVPSKSLTLLEGTSATFASILIDYPITESKPDASTAPLITPFLTKTTTEFLSTSALPTTQLSMISTTGMLSNVMPPITTTSERAFTFTSRFESTTPSSTTKEETIMSTKHRIVTVSSVDHSTFEVSPKNIGLLSITAATENLMLETQTGSDLSSTLELQARGSTTTETISVHRITNSIISVEASPTIKQLPESTITIDTMLTTKNISELPNSTKHFKDSESTTNEGLSATNIDVPITSTDLPTSRVLSYSSKVAITVEPPNVSDLLSFTSKFMSVKSSSIDPSTITLSATVLATTDHGHLTSNMFAESHSLIHQSTVVPSSSLDSQSVSPRSTEHPETSGYHFTTSISMDLSNAIAHSMITDSLRAKTGSPSLTITVNMTRLQVTQTSVDDIEFLRSTTTVLQYPKATPLLPPSDSILETSAVSPTETENQSLVKSLVSSSHTASARLKQAKTIKPSPTVYPSITSETAIAANTQNSAHSEATLVTIEPTPITEPKSIIESPEATRSLSIVPSMSFKSHSVMESFISQTSSLTKFTSTVIQYNSSQIFSQTAYVEFTTMIDPPNTIAVFSNQISSVTQLPSFVIKSEFTFTTSTLSFTDLEIGPTAIVSVKHATISTVVITATRELEPSTAASGILVTKTLSMSSIMILENLTVTETSKEHPTSADVELFPSMTTELRLTASTSEKITVTVESTTTRQSYITKGVLSVTPSMTVKSHDITSLDSLPPSITEYHRRASETPYMMPSIITNATIISEPRSQSAISMSAEPSNLVFINSESKLPTELYSTVNLKSSITVIMPSTESLKFIQSTVTFEATPISAASIDVRPTSITSETADTAILTSTTISSAGSLNKREHSTIETTFLAPTTTYSSATHVSHMKVYSTVLPSPTVESPTPATILLTTTFNSRKTNSKVSNTTQLQLSMKLVFTTFKLEQTATSSLQRVSETPASTESKTVAITKDVLPSSIEEYSTERSIPTENSIFPTIFNQFTTMQVDTSSTFFLTMPTNTVSRAFHSSTTVESQNTIKPPSASLLFSSHVSIASSQTVPESSSTEFPKATEYPKHSTYGSILVSKSTDPIQTPSRIIAPTELPHISSNQSPIVSVVPNITNIQISAEVPDLTHSRAPSFIKSSTATELYLTATVQSPMPRVIPNITEFQTPMKVFSTTILDEAALMSQLSSTGYYTIADSPTALVSQILSSQTGQSQNSLTFTMEYSMSLTLTDDNLKSTTSEEYLTTTVFRSKESSVTLDSSDSLKYPAATEMTVKVTKSLLPAMPTKSAQSLSTTTNNVIPSPTVESQIIAETLNVITISSNQTNSRIITESTAIEFLTNTPDPTGIVVVTMVTDTPYVDGDHTPTPSFIVQFPTITGVKLPKETEIPNTTEIQISMEVLSTTILEKPSPIAQTISTKVSSTEKSLTATVSQIFLPSPTFTAAMAESTYDYEGYLATATPQYQGSSINFRNPSSLSSDSLHTLPIIANTYTTFHSELATKTLESPNTATITHSTVIQFQTTISPPSETLQHIKSIRTTDTESYYTIQSSPTIAMSTTATITTTKYPTTSPLKIVYAYSSTKTHTNNEFTTTAVSSVSSLHPTTVAKLTCKREVKITESVTFIWPETAVNTEATFTCPKNSKYSISRKCQYGGRWGQFNEQGCGILTKDFVNLMKTSEKLTNNTLGQTAETLSTLVKQSVNRTVEHSYENLNEISSTLENMANYVNTTNVMIKETVSNNETLGVVDNIVETLSSLLRWTPDALLPNSSSKIMESFEMVTSQYTQQILPNTAVNFTAPSVTLTAENVAVETLQKAGRNLAFNINGKPDREHVIPGQLFPEQDAAISLPASLFKVINATAMSNVGMFFGMYENATLFPLRGRSVDDSGSQTQVCSRVLAATVGQSISIRDLQESVTVTFRLQNKLGMSMTSGSEKCVSWDFDLQDWTPSGCDSSKSTDSDGVIVCHCNHLTNFAVIVDVCSLPGGCETPTEPSTVPASTQLNGLNNSFTNLTTDTYGDAVSDLADIIGGTEESTANQNSEVLDTVATYFTTLSTFVNQSDVMITSSVVADVVQVVSSLIQWQPENVMVDSSSSLVESFEMVIAQYAQQLPLNANQTFTLPSLTVVAESKRVKDLTVEGRSFKIGKEEAVLGPEGHVKSGQLSPHQHAAVNLPASLFHQIDNHTSIGIFFMLYETATLFPVENENGANSNETEVGSRVLSITVGSGLNFQELTHNITIVLRLKSKNSTVHGSEKCVSWDFDLQDWTTRGCTTIVGNDEVVTCNCNHLTNFAVLVDICLRQEDCAPSKVDFFLTYVSYIGMSISIVFLVITILTLLIFKEVRQKDVSKYHIQMSLAILLMLLVSFVLVGMSAENVVALYGGCMTVSVLVHYFTLVSVMWMGAEALLMFQKLVYVFYQITTKFIVFVSIVCWTMPIVLVVIPLIADLATGQDITTDIIIKRANETEDISYCFLSHVGAFWGAFLAPIFVVMIFNLIIFIRVIIVMIRHTRDSAARQNKSVSNQTIIRLMISISGVMFLFGLTWLFAIFTFSATGLKETFEILFVVFNSFQGLFIFLFVCVLNKDVLESWREIISCGTYRSKLLHPSPVKPVAVRKYNVTNSAGFTSSTSAGKYLSETLKDSYDSSTLTSQSAIENVPKPARIVTETSTRQRVEVTPATNQNSIVIDEDKEVETINSATAISCHHEVDVRVDIHVHSYNSDHADVESTIEQV